MEWSCQVLGWIWGVCGLQERWLSLRAVLQHVVPLLRRGPLRPPVQTLKYFGEVEGLFPRATGYFHHHRLHPSFPASAGGRQVVRSKGFCLSLVLDPRGCPGAVEAPSKCGRWRWRHATSASQMWVRGGCAEPSLGLCFGESLLATEASEMLVLVPPQNSPPIPSPCGRERCGSPGCAGSPARAGTSAAASHLRGNVFLPKHGSYCSVDDFFLLLSS